MNITIPIILWQVYIILGLRAVALVLMAAVIYRMWQELRESGEVKNTKILLLILGVVFFLGSLPPAEQAYCYLTQCFNIAHILPLGILTASLNLISVAIFLLIYFTKEVDNHEQNT